MCILCKDRLFRIPNPCCCCSLRCGTLWISIISFVYGGISITTPYVIGVQITDDDFNNTETTEIHTHYVRDVKPPPERSMTLTGKIAVHYGGYALQSISAAYLALTIMCRLGGACNFFAGTFWMISRILITILWSQFLYSIFRLSASAQQSVWFNYSVLMILNMIIHAYFFLVIRYFTMESWDLWRYRPVTPQLQFRMRSQPKEGKKPSKHPKKMDNLTKWRRLKRQKDAKEDFILSATPIWGIRNEFIIKGEEYTNFDPWRHYAIWERLVNSGILELGVDEVFNEAKYLELTEDVDAELGKQGHVDAEENSKEPITSLKTVNEKDQGNTKSAKSAKKVQMLYASNKSKTKVRPTNAVRLSTLTIKKKHKK